MEAGIIGLLATVALVWIGFRLGGTSKNPDGTTTERPLTIDGPVECEFCGEQVDRINRLFTGDYACDVCELLFMDG